jgi:hypothetical protein
MQEKRLWGILMAFGDGGLDIYPYLCNKYSLLTYMYVETYTILLT